MVAHGSRFIHSFIHSRHTRAMSLNDPDIGEQRNSMLLIRVLVMLHIQHVCAVLKLMYLWYQRQ